MSWAYFADLHLTLSTEAWTRLSARRPSETALKPGWSAFADQALEEAFGAPSTKDETFAQALASESYRGANTVHRIAKKGAKTTVRVCLLLDKSLLDLAYPLATLLEAARDDTSAKGSLRLVNDGTYSGEDGAELTLAKGKIARKRIESASELVEELTEELFSKAMKASVNPFLPKAPPTAAAGTAGARKEVVARLARFSAKEIADAAAATGALFGLGYSQRRIADAYPDPDKLAKAVLSGDKTLGKRDAEQVKASAALLLVQLDDAVGTPLAVALLEDPDQSWHSGAVDALAWSRRDEALAALLAGEATMARFYVGTGLGRSRHPAAAARVFERLAQAAKEGDDALEEMTGFLHAIGEKSYEPARALLQRITKDTKKLYVREAAAHALSKFTSSAALDDAARELASPNVDLRILAVESLFRKDAARAYEPLERYFDADTETAETTLLALMRHRSWFDADPRWKALCERLLEKDTALFFDAWRLLADGGDVRAEAVLSMIGESPLGSALAASLFLLPPSALPVLEAELRRREEEDKANPSKQKHKGDRGTLRNVIKHLSAKEKG